jgi:cytochrome c oxidase subunit II
LAPPRKRRLALVLLAASLLSLAVAAPAAANVISPEPAHSPQADEITTLYWIGLVVAVLLAVAINGALLYAIVRFRSERGAEPRQIRSGRGIQLRAGAALGVVALGLLVVGLIYTERARETPDPGPEGLQASSRLLAQRSLKPPSGGSEPLQITATGQQWLWRYDYPNDTFSFYKVVVPVDTPVILRLVSTDVVHTWYVPELAGKFDAVPGKLNKVVLSADEEGVYEGSSATFSGQGFSAMRTEVQVVSAEEYQAFLEQQKQDLQEAQEQAAAALQREETL